MMGIINKTNIIKKASSVIIGSAILIFSVAVSVSANTINDTLVNNDKVESIVNKNGTIITLQANDEKVKYDLVQKVEEIIDDINPVRGCITSVDIETNEVIGVARFNRN